MKLSELVSLILESYPAPHKGRKGEIGGSAPRTSLAKRKALWGRSAQFGADHPSAAAHFGGLSQLTDEQLEQVAGIDGMVRSGCPDYPWPGLGISFTNESASWYDVSENDYGVGAIYINPWDASVRWTEGEWREEMQADKAFLRDNAATLDEQTRAFFERSVSYWESTLSKGVPQTTAFLLPKDEALKAVVLHELGHHYLNTLAKGFGAEHTTDGTDLGDWKSGDSLRKAAAGLSNRALDNLSECVAEAFVARAIGRNDLIPDAIREQFDRDGIWKRPTTVSEFVGTVREATMPDTIIREPVCFTCKHLVYWPLCEAFLGDIPTDIRNGENDHSKPVEGDHGTQYERYEKVKETHTVRDLVNQVRGD